MLLPVFFLQLMKSNISQPTSVICCVMLSLLSLLLLFFASLLTLLQLSIISVQAFLVKACFFFYSLNSSIGSLDKSRACVTIKIVNFSSSFCSYWQILSVCLSLSLDLRRNNRSYRVCNSWIKRENLLCIRTNIRKKIVVGCFATAKRVIAKVLQNLKLATKSTTVSFQKK